MSDRTTLMKSLTKIINNQKTSNNPTITSIYANNPFIMFLIVLSIMGLMLYSLNYILDNVSNKIAFDITRVETNKRPN